MRPRVSAADPLPSDPLKSAVAAGLRYVNGSGAGIQRVRCGAGFRYIAPGGRTIRDPQELRRIKALVIPPAWRDVWICPSPFGHIQAVGRDARGRKQYRYHASYRQVRDQVKFSRMVAFGAVLPRIRKRMRRDLKRPGLSREKVLATVVRLLETTCVRIGNAEYARENDSFGLTTLRDRHVRISGATMRFEFKGKSGQKHQVELTDQRLARIVRACQELPGYELFQYIDESGNRCTVDSGDVNEYLRKVTGQDFTAKDFRTWAGTVLAARELAALGTCRSQTEGKKKMVSAVRSVARQLGNRPAACRKYYIHPAILEAYCEGALQEAVRNGAEQNPADNGKGLRAEERCVLAVITAKSNGRHMNPRLAA